MNTPTLAAPTYTDVVRALRCLFHADRNASRWPSAERVAVLANARCRALEVLNRCPCEVACEASDRG